MTIWHTKEEKPEVATGFAEASLLIKRDNSYGVWYQIIAFYEFEKYKNVIIEWCTIADLLSLEQRLQAKDEEIKELERLFKVGAMEEIKNLKENLQQAKEGLEFYAKAKHFEEHSYYDIMLEWGEKARETLEIIDKE